VQENGGSSARGSTEQGKRDRGPRRRAGLWRGAARTTKLRRRRSTAWVRPMARARRERERDGEFGEGELVGAAVQFIEAGGERRGRRGGRINGRHTLH
jgi:hypothetical protein